MTVWDVVMGMWNSAGCTCVYECSTESCNTASKSFENCFELSMPGVRTLEIGR